MFKIKSKKAFALMVAILTMLLVVSCTDEQSSSKKKSSSEVTSVLDAPIYEVDFLNYYKSNKHFYKVEPLLKQYFNSVQKAYNDSDKNDLVTFELEVAGQAAAESLISYYNTVEASEDTTEERLKLLNTYEPFLEVNTVVAEINLIVVASGGESVNQPDTFAKLKQAIDNAIKEYSGYDSLENKTFNFITDEGEARYRIIRSEECLESARIAAVLWKALKEKGVSCRNQTDYEDDTDFEILIGNTNRPESQTALDKLQNESGSWIVCSIGRKIVINAVDPADLETAVEYYIDNYFSLVTPTYFEEYISK